MSSGAPIVPQRGIVYHALVNNARGCPIIFFALPLYVPALCGANRGVYVGQGGTRRIQGRVEPCSPCSGVQGIDRDGQGRTGQSGPVCTGEYRRRRMPGAVCEREFSETKKRPCQKWHGLLYTCYLLIRFQTQSPARRVRGRLTTSSPPSSSGETSDAPRVYQRRPAV